MLSVSVIQTLENGIRIDINFTCKGRSERSKERYILFYTINSMYIYVAKDKPRKKKKKKKERSQNKKIKRKKIPSKGLEPTAFVNIKFLLQKRYHWTNVADI